MLISAAKPCLRAFLEDIARPSGVVGPFDFAPFEREVSIWASVRGGFGWVVSWWFSGIAWSVGMVLGDPFEVEMRKRPAGFESAQALFYFLVYMTVPNGEWEGGSQVSDLLTS